MKPIITHRFIKQARGNRLTQQVVRGRVSLFLPAVNAQRILSQPAANDGPEVGGAA